MILLDVDGVLADIHTPLCAIMGFDMSKWIPGEYWMEKSFKTTAEQIWEHPKIKDPKFWSEAPKTPWADDIMARLLAMRYEVCFLTKPVRELSCLTAKAQWLTKYWPKIPYLIGTSKKFCAHEDSTLIDDCDANINEFEHYGGHGILFPRIWNSGYAIKDPWEHVKQFI